MEKNPEGRNRMSWRDECEDCKINIDKNIHDLKKAEECGFCIINKLDAMEKENKEYTKQNEKILKDILESHKIIEQLRECLEWYAEGNYYSHQSDIVWERGQKARDVLNKLKEQR